MRTSGHLAAAAGHLAELVRYGQNDLIEQQGETRLAGHLRDQVARQLSTALTDAITRLGDDPRHAPVVRAAADLMASLQARRTGLAPTDVAGAAPTALALRPPATRSARAWAGAAAELETAVVQASRAGIVDEATWRAVIVDSAAIASALAWADVDLGRSLAWSDGPGSPRQGGSGLSQAAHELLAGGLADMRRHALAVLAQASALEVPDRYHLTGRVTGVSAVTAPSLIPTAIERTVLLLEDQGTLTGRQQRALATAAAAVASRLRQQAARLGDDAAASALRTASQAQLRLAAAWQRADHLWCVPDGSGEAPGQLWAAAEAARSLGPAGMPIDQVRRSAAGLALLTSTARRALEASLSREHWLARREDAQAQGQWVTIGPVFEESGVYRFAGVTGSVIDQRLARLAAGAVVTSYGFTGAEDDDAGDDQDLGAVAPRAVTGLRQILAAQQAAIVASRAAASGATSGLSTTRSADLGLDTGSTVRAVLAGAPYLLSGGAPTDDRLTDGAPAGSQSENARTTLHPAAQTHPRRADVANAGPSTTTADQVPSSSRTGQRQETAAGHSSTLAPDAQIEVGGHDAAATLGEGNRRARPPGRTR